MLNPIRPFASVALEAVAWAIDEVKRLVPIWKKEKYIEIEATDAWKKNKEFDQLKEQCDYKL